MSTPFHFFNLTQTSLHTQETESATSNAPGRSDSAFGGQEVQEGAQKKKNIQLGNYSAASRRGRRCQGGSSGPLSPDTSRIADTLLPDGDSDIRMKETHYSSCCHRNSFKAGIEAKVKVQLQYFQRRRPTIRRVVCLKRQLQLRYCALPLSNRK